ncbi:LysR family transcriptional regulator [Amycolatopsis suaedae]|uniref:LysR family transcriptional regulator n=1 Tax=Amycolatopsis suaedae TaxID=2510978 RepID=A0A4Q7JCD4_9PSEU|nr:LysR family transcriptional regulator [Amycolatopsis suaedae]RZQ64692.1 LysR family transcriptional regulator [Amycolatopsis suaedae]
MDARQLRYFLAIVDENGFNRAADRLHLAQPSLSQAIRAMEKELGVDLFHRIGRRAVLTDAGHALVVPARQVLRDLDAARDTARSVAAGLTGVVDVAAMPSQAVDPLSGMIAEFSAAHPGIRTVVHAAFTPQEVLEAVRTGRAEVGVLGAAEDVALPGVVRHRVDRQRFVLLVPPDSDLGDVVTREQLGGRPVIAAPPGTRMRHVVDQIVAAGVDLRIVVETAHREIILPLVLNGVGVAVTTAAWAPLARRAGARVAELEPAAALEVSLIHRASPLTPAAQRFTGIALDR